ncbi:MAG: CBS domain-containing protein [Bacteroidota bacterium]
MRAIELITQEIPPLKASDTGEKALEWMDELKVTHLPVLKKGNFVGLISESDLLDKMSLNENLDQLFDHLPRPYVYADAHIYEIMKRIADHKISVLPILDKEEKYLGCTSIYHLLTVFANTGSIKETGGIIVVEMNAADYSMAKIAQIVEGNGAKILSSYIMSAVDSTKVELTLKINQIELSSIIRTFERYDYVIKETYQKSSSDDDLQDRFDSLMYYLRF